MLGKPPMSSTIEYLKLEQILFKKANPIVPRRFSGGADESSLHISLLKH
jgi:hypothetical protein